MKNKDNFISSVLEGSIGEEVGMEPGDTLITINNKKVIDIIDYLFLISDEYLEIEVRKNNGEIWSIEIEKEYDEELGIEFSSPILDCAKSCMNNCIFCFIDQMPKGMRESLYFKDDDSRLSFLQGNFVTLTNLSDQDIDRIIEYNISPINVSVHTTNSELRKTMLNNKFAGNIMERLNKLVSNRVQVNGQIVLCPGYNDGDELLKTVMDLFNLGGSFNSLAIVPIGLTKYRDNLTIVDDVTKKMAISTIKDIENLQEEFFKKRGTRFVFLSDEFYLKAEIELPKYEEYENFSQIENGIGLIRKLETEIYENLSNLEKWQGGDRIISIATGMLAYKFINSVANQISNKFSNLKIIVYPIVNEFFGDKITVAGLITAVDIITQLSEKELGDTLFIPKVMLKTGEDVFLDDITLVELENRLHVKIKTIENSGEDFIRKILF